ncbi:MAG: hypothetical protein LBI13_05890 [Streptococcaceae bacterium]|jgi:predicted  nucleic acid-binding Zn-ribbon protein|nr:hypothetical protein [Streptococcaceae bacterium]
MVKDKNAEARYDYNQKISQTERELDDLQGQEHQLQNQIDDFENLGNKEFQKLLAINDDLVRRGSFSAQWDLEEIKGKAQYFKKMISDQQEELGKIYRKSSQDIEAKREHLQKERDGLTWD